MSKILFIFLDGLGMGDAKDNNPFTHAEMPFLDKLLGDPLIKGVKVSLPGFLLKGIDACLGIEGIPQSATGQTALFTGVNAAEILGYHLPAFPNSKLKEIIDNSNIMKEAVLAGKRAVFANSYSPKYFDMVDKGIRVHSVTTLCTIAAGIKFRNIDDLKKGNAVHWDITNKYLKEQQNTDVSVIKPGEAGKNLAGILRKNDLVVYESFLPDFLGHKFDFRKAVEFLEMLDFFLSGILENIWPEVTVVISSDHGNIEEIGNGGHTRNPVPLLVFGNNSEKFTDAENITDISGKILNCLIKK